MGTLRSWDRPQKYKKINDKFEALQGLPAAARARNAKAKGRIPTSQHEVEAKGTIPTSQVHHKEEPEDYARRQAADQARREAEKQARCKAEDQTKQTEAKEEARRHAVEQAGRLAKEKAMLAEESAKPVMQKEAKQQEVGCCWARFGKATVAGERARSLEEANASLAKRQRRAEEAAAKMRERR
jgi:translation initiation factor IF-2